MKIVFNNVTKSFGAITALKEINLEINSGDFVFLVGPSGAGKSTLLKLVLNQIQPTSGEILINDINMFHGRKNQVDKTRRNIGVIFQDYQLISDKSIEENIALALDIVSYPVNKISAKIDEVLKKVNLTNRRNLFPSQLSSGELQRAALARALSIDPKIILADEPTGNLDAENTWNLIKLLQNINENNKTTILMTTHNLDIIDSLDKRIIRIANGTLESDSNKKNTSLKEHKSKKHDNA